MTDKEQELLNDSKGQCISCGEIKPLLGNLCEECYG